jgi:hypothetical protein
MFPVRYELEFYIPDDGILHSHLREYLKYYIRKVVASLIETHRCCTSVRIPKTKNANFSEKSKIRGHLGI